MAYNCLSGMVQATGKGRMQKRSPTIKDVALHAGVSSMTVSRVCNPNSSGYISDATRERVLISIGELGYRPNALARSVRTGRIDTVGFYNGYRGLFLLEHEFQRTLFNGLQEASAALKQDLLIFTVPEYTRPATEVVRELSTSRVDGVVLLPQAGDEELVRRLGESHKRAVAIVEALPGLPAITAQDADGSRRLAEYLFAIGHRKILYRTSRMPLVSASRRYAGFAEAAGRLGITVLPTVQSADLDDVDRAERERIKGHAREGFTAIVCWHDYSAYKALLVCREEGIRIPEELAVAGFDHLKAPICPPDVDLTTIQVDWAEIAMKSVAYIVNGWSDSPAGSGQTASASDEITVESPLHVGNTT